MVHIIQLLCPQRHCIVGVAYETDDLSTEVALKGFNELVKQMIENKAFNPWCGICLSPELRAEDGPTKYRTMEEARPEIEKLEAANMLTRSMFSMDFRKS